MGQPIYHTIAKLIPRLPIQHVGINQKLADKTLNPAIRETMETVFCRGKSPHFIYLSTPLVKKLKVCADI